MSDPEPRETVVMPLAGIHRVNADQDQHQTGQPGDLSQALADKPIWTDQDLHGHGIPIIDVAFASVGGGLGSFAMIDTLRIAGVPTEFMVALSNLDRPSDTYEYLATNSQIPRVERLRSDSGSVMDCIWGWPGYALREAIADRSVKPIWQVMTEPVLSEYFTPRAGQVYESVAREATRIGWDSMLRSGVVRTVRRREGGDYFVLFTPEPGQSATRRVAYRCRFVHIAVGYPGVKFLPDLQAYRDTHNDFSRVVNAYEQHSHVYEELKRRPCTVLLRGSGIVGSRVLQRIINDRDHHGAQTTIIHLFRNYPDGFQGDRRTFRRPAKRGWAYQPFNFPKSAWGGQLRDKLNKLEGAERSALIDAMGGTNTASRADWQKQLERGWAQGFYRQHVGTVERVAPGDGAARGKVRTQISDQTGATTIDADFIIDATGLEASIEEHRVLDELLRFVGARKNPKGRLDVDHDFLIRGTENDQGRLYASGSITLGGYYAGVDSFLGLQYAALRIHDALAKQGFGAKIGLVRSTSQWLKWARNKQP